MSMLDDAFGGGQGSASDDIAQGYQNSISTYEKYLDQINQMFQPWMDRGNNSGDNMYNMGQSQQAQFNQMMGMGEGGTGNWQTEYTASPWAQYQTDVGTQTMDANAASSGMLGSGNNQRSEADMAEGIASQDRQQYYNDMMGMGSAASGNYSPLMQTGAGMTSELGNYTYGTGQSIGHAQQGIGQANAMGDTANSSMWNNAINTGLAAAGAFGGGGTAMTGGMNAFSAPNDQAAINMQGGSKAGWSNSW